MIPRWEDINDSFVYRVGQDTLELSTFGISSEFIDGKNPRQPIRLSELKQVHPAANGRFGNTERPGNLFSRLLLLQLIDP